MRKSGIDLAVPSITVWLMEPSESTSTRRGHLARAAEALPPNSTAISSLFAPVTLPATAGLLEWLTGREAASGRVAGDEGGAAKDVSVQA